eukprot:GEMP01019485.1.p1 GENE.GEMP01019485.1~~GEMP01019485.1.p1  ORF type:complete len:380 (+),score=65.17 GEMP01019485.1:73-1212(+)
MDETMPAEVWYDERFWQSFDVIEPRTPTRNPLLNPVMPVYLGSKNNVAFVQKAPFWVVAEPNGVKMKQFDNPFSTMRELECAAAEVFEGRGMRKRDGKDGRKGNGKGKSRSRSRSPRSHSRTPVTKQLYLHWWSQLYYKGKLQNKDSALWDLDRSFGWCHRIDKGTSGLMLLALTKDTHDFMRKQWNELHVWKKYICLAQGFPPYARMNSAPIATTHLNKHGRGKGGYSKSDTKDDGKPAQTFIEVLGRYKYKGEYFALCSCEIMTGRTHQIRIHMKTMGHSLVGDQAYGVKGGKCPLSMNLGMNRPFLHAVAASFTVPDDNFRLIVVNALTPDLMDVLRKLEYVGRGLDASLGIHTMRNIVKRMPIWTSTMGTCTTNT